MKRIALLLAACAAPALAQAPAPMDLKTFASSAEVQALVAKARSEIKPGQPNLNQPILSIAPYRATIEYRVGTTPALLHLFDAELVYVISGSGTFTTGGALADAKPPTGGNIVGTTITGGTDNVLAPGNLFLIPEKMPHWFHDLKGEVILLTFHVPRPIEWPK